MSEDKPTYYRLYADAWDEVNHNLPRAQAAKLLYAMAAYFFEGEEPSESELPKPARALFNIQRSQIANYRKNALNGRKANQKPDKNLSETCEKPDQLFTQKPTQEIEVSNTHLPAETQNLGHKAPAKAPAKRPSNIINHKSVITNEADALLPSAERSVGVSQPDKQNPKTLRVDTGTESPRAEAGAGQGRPAPALPSWAELMGGAPAPEEPVPDRAEYDRVERMLQDGRFDELTEQDRKIYHAGHKAYAPGGYQAE